MTIIEAIRDWLRTYPPLADGRLGVDCLPEEAQTYSIDAIPCPEVIKGYMDGAALKQFDFVLASRVFHGNKIKQNMDNLEWYESFSRWVRAQNQRPKHLPDLGEGRTAQRVTVSTSGYLYQVSEEGRARYQIQLKLIYFEQGGR